MSSQALEDNPLRSLLFVLFDNSKTSSIYWSDFRYCTQHDSIVEGSPLHADTEYNRECMVCGTTDLTGLSAPLPPIRNKADLDAVREAWKASAVSKRVVERDAYVRYLKVAVCAVRPSVIYAADRTTQSYNDYVAFLEQFEKDAFERRALGMRGDTIMRMVCPEHKTEGHLFPSLGVDRYQSCHCCLKPLSSIERHSSAAYERDEDVRGVKSLLSR